MKAKHIDFGVRSNARVRVPAGVDVYIRHQHTAANGGAYAEVGWRAILP